MLVEAYDVRGDVSVPVAARAVRGAPRAERRRGRAASPSRPCRCARGAWCVAGHHARGLDVYAADRLLRLGTVELRAGELAPDRRRCATSRETRRTREVFFTVRD
ncbi:MAG: hypothetical protein MZV64_25905 [Ignavibacteriales bacterium]|nr:hypothetical protein [Ignavibacteriales bacterium]